MARRDIERFARNLRRGVGRAYAQKSMRAAGELAIAVIVDRTRRRGRGVSRTNGKEHTLKPFKNQSYIDYRGTQKLHSETSAGRSNLTLSGKLLDSMVIKKVGNKIVRWGPKANKRQGEGITNEQLGEYVAKAGRPFNFLSKKDIKKITILIDKILQLEMKRV